MKQDMAIKKMAEKRVTRKIRVLECIRQGRIGGGESHLLSLTRHLDKTRFEPLVLSFTDGPMIDQLRQMGVETRLIHTEKPFDIRVWRKVKRLLETERIDIVHAHGTRAGSNVLWAARSLGIPVIYSVHGWSFHRDQHPLVRRLRIMGEQWLTKRSTLNISVSASNQQTGKDVIPSFESVVVNNGIDAKRFDPNGRYKDLRAELGIAADKVLVVFIARFTAHKQPLTLIDAFSKALEEVDGAHLLMVGDGDEKEAGEQLVQRLGLGHHVRLEGFRQDVPDVLSAADVFVLPSLWEGLPIGLLEAMAMRKAVIGTRVDGTREVLQDGVNGLMVEPGDAGALSAAIVRLVKDKRLRESLACKAEETVRNRFNAAAMTREIENIYLKIIPYGI
ncbi:MAG TPA: glycosyltransferase family 4 protein [Puia sp.]|nr:glycosyltransferase family 4 protein [Puia sp.]